MLPSGWTQSTVGDACVIKNNLRLPLSAAERSLARGSFPYFGPTGVLDYIDHHRIDEPFALIGEDGDHFLKFNQRPMTLRYSGKANVNNHAHVIVDSDRCLSDWFYYWFMHRDITPVLSRQGVGRYKLTKAGLCALEIALPPIDEQKAIVRLLDAWDNAIGVAELLTSNSRTECSLLKQHLFSEKRQSRDQTSFQPKKISELIQESRVPGSGGHEARKLTVKLYGKGVVGKSEKRIGSESTQYFRRAAGQFIYSKLDFLNGAFGLIPSNLDGYESTLDLPAFDFLPGVEPPWFLYFVSRQEFYRSQLGLANGGRKARRVNPKDLLRICIPVPPIDEQVRIADSIAIAEAIVRSNEREVELLRTEKVALMQKLLTGKRRVNQLKPLREAAA